MELELKPIARLLVEDLKYAKATKNKEYEKIVLDAQNEFHDYIRKVSILTAQIKEIKTTVEATEILLSRDNL